VINYKILAKHQARNAHVSVFVHQLILSFPDCQRLFKCSPNSDPAIPMAISV